MNACVIAIFWAVISVVFCLVLGRIAWKNKQVDDQTVSVDSDMEDAVGALVGLGYKPDDAAERVVEARIQFPTGDINKLVNIAIRL